MIRLVIDTDVMVAAFDSPFGASRQLLLAALDGRFRPLLSTPLMVEYESVLCRPANLEKFGIGVVEVLAVLDELAAICIPVAFDYRWRPSGADADDELVIETAINGQADAIATFNLRHIGEAARRFGITAERPGSVLRRIRT
ncbi:PilT domain-containing protein [Magnetospirillum sp. LM-5]|uniref:putative toxin-antitoxin system toxin component, PIN family n=1 Tax=Magnetospirillum sp. LM-5 TaxID=2681466 RepID=UPI001385154C|nr:putative toxin-antitoxin system toxin component, PIN family [Magnetospirillum sp. LM-5]CAA7611622.1 PilT domain-containing protein [Magnetospirillum sp. LM-5]